MRALLLSCLLLSAAVSAGGDVLAVGDGARVERTVLRVGPGADGPNEVRLRGGTLAIAAKTTDPNIFVQGGGALRGWGRTLDTAMGDNNVRLVMDGLVVADGEGEARSLDLGRAVVSTAVELNGVDGTNGWYAVNRGKLFYPRRWIKFGAAEKKDWVLGENGAADALDLVNSLGGTIAAADGGWASGGVVRAALFAADRTDYPAGIPVADGQVLLGVWAVWTQRSHLDATRIPFTSTSVRIRYDRARLGAGGRVALYRLQGGAWRRLFEGPQPEDAVVSAEDQRPLAGERINVGWYAVVGERGTGADAAPRAPAAPVAVDARIPAGNIVLKSARGDRVQLATELRDTDGWWFYWAFRATGAPGRRVRFAFTDGEAVGTRGPAVSTDRGATWSYAAERFDAKSFTYRFPQDAREVWFSMGIPYTQRHWDAFLARQAAKAGRFESGALCTTKKGRAVERLRVGRLDGGAKHRIFLTCRHHCCEMTASYVLEGALEAMLGDDELGAWYRAHAEVVAVPFVDKDGVEEGDQGKNRKPWDHCRDYNDDRAPIHREVAAIRELLPSWSGNPPDIVVDIHCPWIRGGQYNERIYQVGIAPPSLAAAQVRFGKILEQVQSAGCAYAQANDLPYGQKWNADRNYTKGSTFIQWAARRWPEMPLATSFEIPYANVDAITLDEAKFRGFGRDLAAAFREFLETRGE